MPDEIVCPSCRARLLVRHDSGEAWFLCPRCLGRVPNPARPEEGIVAGPAPGPRTPPAVPPTVEREEEAGEWVGYVAALVLTVVALVGTVLGFRYTFRHTVQDTTATALVIGAITLMVALSALIVYPVGRRQVRAARQASANLNESAGAARARYVSAIVLIGFLFPLAFFIVFFTACSALLIGEAL